MKEQRGGRQPSGITAPMANKQCTLCYDGNLPANNDNEKKQNFLQHKERYKIPKKLTQIGQRAWERR